MCLTCHPSILYKVTSLSGHDPAHYKAATPTLASWDISWYWLIVYLSLKPRRNNELPSEQNIYKYIIIPIRYLKGTVLDLPHWLVKLSWFLLCSSSIRRADPHPESHHGCHHARPRHWRHDSFLLDVWGEREGQDRHWKVKDCSVGGYSMLLTPVSS